VTEAADRLAPLKAALAARRDRCFLCSWILQDFERHGRLTDWPIPETVPAGSMFPRLSKHVHLWLEFVTPRTGEGIRVKQMLDAAAKLLGHGAEAKQAIAETERLIAVTVMECLTSPGAGL